MKFSADLLDLDLNPPLNIKLKHKRLEDQHSISATSQEWASLRQKILEKCGIQKGTKFLISFDPPGGEKVPLHTEQDFQFVLENIQCFQNAQSQGSELNITIEEVPQSTQILKATPEELELFKPQDKSSAAGATASLSSPATLAKMTEQFTENCYLYQAKQEIKQEIMEKVMEQINPLCEKIKVLEIELLTLRAKDNLYQQGHQPFPSSDGDKTVPLPSFQSYPIKGSNKKDSKNDVICRVCKRPIQKNIYKCRLCRNYYLCEVCETQVMHLPGHEIYKVRHPKHDAWLAFKSYQNEESPKMPILSQWKREKKLKSNTRNAVAFSLEGNPSVVGFNKRVSLIWLIRNTGGKIWSSDTVLKCMDSSEGLQAETPLIQLPPLLPNEEWHITLNFHTTDKTGPQYSQWCFFHRKYKFGPQISCNVVVMPLKATNETPKTPDSKILTKDPEKVSKQEEEIEVIPKESKKQEEFKDKNNDSLTNHIYQIYESKALIEEIKEKSSEASSNSSPKISENINRVTDLKKSKKIIDLPLPPWASEIDRNVEPQPPLLQAKDMFKPWEKEDDQNSNSSDNSIRKEFVYIPKLKDLYLLDDGDDDTSDSIEFLGYEDIKGAPQQAEEIHELTEATEKLVLEDSIPAAPLLLGQVNICDDHAYAASCPPEFPPECSIASEEKIDTLISEFLSNSISIEEPPPISDIDFTILPQASPKVNIQDSSSQTDSQAAAAAESTQPTKNPFTSGAGEQEVPVLPEILVNGVFGAASQVYNAAKQVIYGLPRRPEHYIDGRGRCYYPTIPMPSPTVNYHPPPPEIWQVLGMTREAYFEFTCTHQENIYALKDMGFTDEAQLINLLMKHKGDISLVVESLLQDETPSAPPRSSNENNQIEFD